MPSALACLKASTRMAVWDWGMARSEIWIQHECQVNILLLSAATIIHSRITARKETWKPFPSLFSVLISRSLAHILSITIAHLFSFVSPLVSPFNPFSFPPQFPLQLLSFQPDLSIFPYLYSTPLSVFSPALWQALSHFLHLSVIFLPFLLTFRSFFSLWLLPFPDFSPLLLAHFVRFALFLSQHSLFTLSDALSPSILSKALYGPIKFSSLMSFPMLYTWADRTVQVVQGRIRTHTHTQDGFNNVALKHVGPFKVFSFCESPSLSERFTDPPKNLIYTHSQARDLIYNNAFGLIFPRAHPRIATTKTACFFNSKQCKQAVSALY